ncbi:hypothetical protein SBY92_002487 [Candida maltosa Xu316]|uniref:Uncharacterized protein n=1 Tax=Candida maltosa (strain Xu316) TaxID=1245528 RepID=M3IIV2_CANMX|nr:hypothetical protein G210_3455 [Candida maltosa Xu316]
MVNPAHGSPMSHKLIVGTIAVIAGGYVAYKTGSDFQFVKFVPHSPEEIERRKRENVGLKMTVTDETTLDLTPEAKERIRKRIIEQQAKAGDTEK